jgi:hypothetical protein
MLFRVSHDRVPQNVVSPSMTTKKKLIVYVIVEYTDFQMYGLRFYVPTYTYSHARA